MSRFRDRLRAALVCTGLLLIAGCSGTSVNAPDLLQALPEPAPAPATAPDVKPPPGARKAGALANRGQVEWVPRSTIDFTGSRLDTSIWQPYNSEGGFGNGLRRPSAITVKNGNLFITARGNVSGGMRHEVDQKYGRWEFRARTQPGRGYSSAILLWPQTETKVDGELDMMEVPREGRDAAHFVIHRGTKDAIKGTRVDGDFSQWHEFAMEWLPDRITWYVDGVKQYENREKHRIPTVPMHLTIQLDQGPLKNWLPAPDATTPPEVSLEVDWVKIYRMPNDYR